MADVRAATVDRVRESPRRSRLICGVGLGVIDPEFGVVVRATLVPMSAMFQFRGQPEVLPTLASVARRFRLKIGDLDAGFGVIATNPGDGIYVVYVADEAAADLQKRLARRRNADPVVNVFGNPRVEPT